MKDVVLVSIGMPEVPGYEYTQEFRIPEHNEMYLVSPTIVVALQCFSTVGTARFILRRTQ